MKAFEFELLRDIAEDGQKDMAGAKMNPDYSVTMENLERSGLIKGGKITEDGLQALKPYKVDNAIIMAAGFSARCMPLSKVMPKGLFLVKGESLMEREIRQLIDAGIQEIIVVTGYLHEKFDFLADKYGVKLIYNKDYDKYNNMSSLYAAKDYLKNSYVLCSDNYYEENVFHQYVLDSYYSCIYSEKFCDEFCVTELDDNGVITGIHRGGERAWYTIGDCYYYPYGGNAEKLYICEVPFPQEQPLSMLLPQEQRFDYEASAPRSLKSAAFPKVLVEATVNKKALSFYASYPPSMINENQQTLWAMYANMPMPKAISQTFMAAMKEKIAGLSQLEAMERLLNFVQTAFVYEYDDKVWGCDRAFFPEETLYYPYCDCEDRSILLSRMVRDLLGLHCVLIHYPGHLAMAVQFTDDVKGDCIMLQGEKFTICDPTYIGAHVGETMPGMNNAEAKAILLENK